ncbi:Hypp5924 [Branchiostoma lanceolatum]|uniref:Hypp5924 protein n=1 Tax=Branchiostoma lanceolatum TaxID=7740 RepID=A0A8J9WH38_BRALA|nr:Hypp5924 [Branchiostoma lanceolatum]
MMKMLVRSLMVAVLGIAVYTVAAFPAKDDNRIGEDVSNRQDSDTQVDNKRGALPIDSLLHGAGMDRLGGKRAGRPIDSIMHSFGLPMARRREATDPSDQDDRQEEKEGTSSRGVRAAPIDSLYGGLVSMGTKRAAPIDSIYGGIGLPISGKRALFPNDSIYKGVPWTAKRSGAPIDPISAGRGLPMSIKRASPIDSIIGGNGLPIMNKRRTMALPIDNIIGGYGLPISVRVGNKDRGRDTETVPESDEEPWLRSIW